MLSNDPTIPTAELLEELGRIAKRAALDYLAAHDAPAVLTSDMAQEISRRLHQRLPAAISDACAALAVGQGDQAAAELVAGAAGWAGMTAAIDAIEEMANRNKSNESEGFSRAG